MGTPRPWTDEDTARMVQLHAQGVTLTGIAKDLARSKAIVSRYAALQKPPLSFDRTHTAAATHAKVVDAKAKRAQLELDYLDDAQRLRQQVWMEHEYIDHGGKEFIEVRWTQDQPSPMDKLKLMQASTMAATQSLKLDLHDSGEGNAQVVGLLQRTAAALGLTDHTDIAPPTE